MAPGLPGFTIVGLADTALQEARERVRGAIRNSGYEYPPRRITVNLAPGRAAQERSVARSGHSPGHPRRLGAGRRHRSLGGPRRAFAGRRAAPDAGSAADGRGPGAAPRAAESSCRADGLPEARLADGIEVVAAATLAEAAGLLRESRRGRGRAQPPRVELAADVTNESVTSDRDWAGGVDSEPGPDLAEVRGQIEARRAMELALAGGHCLVMVGPPGSGKTLLARTVPGLLAAARRHEARVGHDHRVGVGIRAGDGPGPDQAVPIAPPHHLVCGHGRRGTAPVAGRSHQGARRSPVSRRAARVRSRDARGPASAARGRPGGDLESGQGGRVSVALPADRGHEPVSVRARRGGRRPLPLPTRGRRSVRGPDIGSACETGSTCGCTCRGSIRTTT